MDYMCSDGRLALSSETKKPDGHLYAVKLIKVELPPRRDNKDRLLASLGSYVTAICPKLTWSWLNQSHLETIKYDSKGGMDQSVYEPAFTAAATCPSTMFNRWPTAEMGLCEMESGLE